MRVALAYDLRQLRRAAGGPSYRQLSRQAHYSVTALSETAEGEVLPTLEVTLAYVTACEGDRDEWGARWRTVAQQLTAGDQRYPDGQAQEVADEQAAP